MPGSTLAGVITAVASVLTALGFVITAVNVLLPLLKTSRRNESQLKEVHTIVNQQRTDLQRYQVALVNALNAAHIDVPADQSIYVAASTAATPSWPAPVQPPPDVAAPPPTAPPPPAPPVP